MFLKLFKNKIWENKDFNPGWVGDERETKDERNYSSEEIFKSYPTPEWKEKKPSEWRKFLPIRNQSSSSACVSFSIALALGVENFLEEGRFEVLSSRFIYSRGYVPDGGGMYYLQALEIARKDGACLEQQMPSDGRNEEQMRIKDDTKNVQYVAQIYKANSYIFLPLDIDVVAGIIQSTNKAILLGTRFNPGGFSKPDVVLDKNGIYGHAVVATDATLWNGKKSIIFQNSWANWGIDGLGIITEEQFRNGVVLAVQLVDFVYQPQNINKPKFIIYSSFLTTGNRGNDVIKLQVGLQWLGLFPATQEVTGYYGGITRQAVKDFQKKYNLQETGIMDTTSINKFNEIFK